MTETNNGLQPVTVPATALSGSTARLVTVRAVPATDPAATTITGLSADAAWTTRDRLRAGILNSAGCAWPQHPVALSVEPDVPAAGDSGLDLAFAVALLAASGQIPTHRLASTLYLGELGLDGALRDVPQVQARLAAAALAGLSDAAVAPGGLTAAALAMPGRVCTARTLAGLVAGLRGDANLVTPRAWPTAPATPDADLADIAPEHAHARRLLEVAAAGGHHLLLSGPSDNAAVMLAERLPGLLPDLDPATAAEVAAAHHAAGTLPSGAVVRHRPPWQATHPGISVIDLTGSPLRPGILAVAHGGVLYCAGAEALSQPARDVLCGVLDQPSITMSGARARTTYPARIQLVLAAHTTTTAEDGATLPAADRRTRLRLARLFDRIDIHATLPSMPSKATSAPIAGSTADVAERVAAARAAAAARWAGQPWAANAEATAQELQAALRRTPTTRFAPLQDLVRAGALSPRGSLQILRLALTIADLAGRGPSADDVAEAIRLRTGRQA